MEPNGGQLDTEIQKFFGKCHPGSTRNNDPNSNRNCHFGFQNLERESINSELNQEKFERSFQPDFAVEQSDTYTNNELRLRCGFQNEIEDTERLQNQFNRNHEKSQISYSDVMTQYSKYIEKK